MVMISQSEAGITWTLRGWRLSLEPPLRKSVASVARNWRDISDWGSRVGGLCEPIRGQYYPGQPIRGQYYLGLRRHGQSLRDGGVAGRDEQRGLRNLEVKKSYFDK